MSAGANDPHKRKKFSSGIYSITAPSGSQYIGSATYLDSRWRTHRSQLANGRHGNGPLSNACKKYGIDQLKFEVVLYCDKADLLMYEQRAIDLLKPEYNIFKVAGSPSGYKHTPEAIEKIRAASKNMSLEVREKLRQIGRVRTFSPEHRARIGAANARRVITDESRAKMSASNNSKGRKFSEEARANMRAAQAVRNQKRILLEAEENERHQQRLF